MSGHRQSALMLHGLPLADRQWLLARVPAQDRAVLEGHLLELAELGIPADQQLARAARSGAASGPAQALRLASPADMAQLLANEPVWLVRQLLSLEAWPWRDAWLATLAPLERDRIIAAAGQQLAPAAAQSLLVRTAAALAAQSPQAIVTVPARKPALRGWFGAARKWI